MSELKEKELYGRVKSEFERLFNHKFGTVHLEITANGHFSEQLKSKVKQDLVFTFIKRMKGSESRSPDITGFAKGNFYVENLITIEVKNETISLWDVYQTKMYAELFNAKYGILVSTEPIPTELKNLHRVHSILNRFMYDTYLGMVEFHSRVTEGIVHDTWFPEPPFRYDPSELSKKALTFEDGLKGIFGNLGKSD